MRLLNQGANKDYQDEYGNTALIKAAEKGHRDLVKKLITKGVDVNLAKIDGVTALHLEVLNNHINIVKLLVNNGANINANAKHNYKDGYTPLILASMEGHIEIVKFLIKNGAITGTQTENECNAFQWAAAKENIDVVSYFLENVAGYKNQAANLIINNFGKTCEN